jgi:hypothetical protein
VTAQVLPFRPRPIGPQGASDDIVVRRAALSAAAENAAAASRNAQDAVERALGCAWANNRAGLIRELERIGFELGERLPNLLSLTRLAEESPAHCPDKHVGSGHGRAA